MTFKIAQAAAITIVLYLLVGFNVVKTDANADSKIEPPEALIALKQALIDR